jgi:hypothetical protein
MASNRFERKGFWQNSQGFSMLSRPDFLRARDLQAFEQNLD